MRSRDPLRMALLIPPTFFRNARFPQIANEGAARCARALGSLRRFGHPVDRGSRGLSAERLFPCPALGKGKSQTFASTDCGRKCEAAIRGSRCESEPSNFYSLVFHYRLRGLLRVDKGTRKICGSKTSDYSVAAPYD